ncbi:MAG: hypothetical protein HYT63_03395 [Candidatus Yanofskybacteria bacterium]|nr:hypothetical protein [Candidatus Yanofskybacteria bacterium]
MKRQPHCNNSILFLVLAAGLLLSAVFVPVYAAEGDPSAEQISAALPDLSAATGQQITTHEQAAQVCDSEKYFEICADIGKKYNLYKPEEIRQVDNFVSEIKGNIANQLQSCQTTECLIGVANELAKKLNTKSPTLAADLDLTPKLVERKQAVITAAKELGVNYEQCRNMDPETAPVELLRACAKLAKDSRVKEIIPEGARQAAEAYGDYADKSVELRASLVSGEFQCGDGSLQGCGNFCLNPGEAARAQGIAGIPPVCRQIAKKFFGASGEKDLENAYTQVGQNQQFIYKKAESVLFATIDGKTLTSPEAIGRYMEEQGKKGNVEAVEKGMDFMIAKGFVKPAEKEYVLKFVRQARDRGGIPDFDACRTNPESCREFIPEDHRGEFEVGIQIDQIMRQEIGFNPRECERGGSDPAIGQKCFEGSKKALSKLEALAAQSPEARRMVAEIKGHISKGEEFEKRKGDIQQVFQSQGGPGGCKSEQECFAYCSDPTHGPECIAFGAKQGVFRGDEAIQRYQQFDQNIQQSNQRSRGLSVEQYNFPGQQQGGFPGQGFGVQGGFPGQGFGVQGGFPGQGQGVQGGFPGQGGYPGQGQGFGYPGGQFGQGQQGQFGGQGPNFGGPAGPSPECFAAIQSGDFARAKTACTVSVPTGVPYQPAVIPVSSQVTYTPYPVCQQGQYWDGRQCVFPPTYSPVGSYVPPQQCPEGQYWVYQANSCKPNDYRPYDSGGYSPYPTYSPGPGSGGGCSQSLINLLGTGCHQMYYDTSGKAIYCDGPMSKSAKEGDTSTTAGCTGPSGSYSPYPTGSYTPPPTCPSGQWWDYARSVCTSSSTYSPYPTTSGSCPSGSHTMGSYCMSDADGTKCGPLNSASTSGFGSCSTYTNSTSYTPYPTYSTTPSGSCTGTSESACTAVTNCKWVQGSSANSSYCYYSSGSGTTYTPYPTATVSGSCSSGSHSMGSYCMSDSDSTKCGPYGSSVSSFGSCSSYQGTSTTYTYSPYPTGSTYSPYPTGGTYSPYPTCPSGQWWDYSTSSCKTTSTTDCTSGYYWNGSSCVSSGSTTYSPYPTYSTYSPYPTYSETTTSYTPPPTTYSPPPESTTTIYYPPPESTTTTVPPSSFDSRAHQMAVARTIMACVDSGGSWNSGMASCQPANSGFFANVLKIFSRFLR